MNKSSIEWTDRTWNPVTGCTPVSEGCRNCYAKRMFERFSPDKKFSDVVCHEDRLEQPKRIKKPSKIFVNSMSDLFHPDVPDEFIFKVFKRMMLTGWHTFMVLTKRPDRMAEYCNRYFSKPLPNVWLGTSVEDQQTADERIPLLMETPAVVLFVSVEPMLGNIDMTKAMYGEKPLGMNCFGFTDGFGYEAFIDWVICGGETGPGARPMHPDWVRNLRDQCQPAGVPFFFKSWGELALKDQADAKCSDFGVLDPDGTFYHGHTGWNGRPIDPDTNEAYMFRVGKKRSGRLIDGREWNEFPEVRNET